MLAASGPPSAANNATSSGTRTTRRRRSMAASSHAGRYRSDAEVRGPDARVVGQPGRCSAQRDLAVLQDVGALRDFQRVAGVLLDQQDPGTLGGHLAESRRDLLHA